MGEKKVNKMLQNDRKELIISHIWQWNKIKWQKNMNLADHENDGDEGKEGKMMDKGTWESFWYFNFHLWVAYSKRMSYK